MDTLFPLNTNDQESLIIHSPCIKLARDILERDAHQPYLPIKENITLLSQKTSKTLESDELPQDR